MILYLCVGYIPSFSATKIDNNFIPIFSKTKTGAKKYNFLAPVLYIIRFNIMRRYLPLVCTVNIKFKVKFEKVSCFST